ncbi:MAG: peptidoglycan-binding protein [Eubacteriales bacterium]|nr:peptidoglycan-binding protein [Eubacteriales bacterium]
MMNRLRHALAALALVALLAATCIPAAATAYPYDTESGDSVKLRKYANTTSVVLATINQGDTVTVLGKSGSFYKVKYNNYTGYAMIEFIDGENESSVPTTTQDPLTGVDSYPYDTTTIARVKLRKSAATSSTALLVIPAEAMITVYSVTSNGFAKIKYNGKNGYVMTDYIVLAGIPTPTPVPTVTVNPEATKYTSLSVGATGSQVRALQEALTELGYYTNTIDSKYGSGTKAAVTAFEKRNGLTQDGVADQALQYLIFEGKPKNTKGYRKVIKALPMVSGITIKSGNTGEAVEKMQTRLRELGYYAGDITGVCDKATLTALKAFQVKMNIANDAIATPDVLTILYGATAISSSEVVTPTPTPTIAPPTDTLRSGDTGDDVKKVQQRLTDLGYYSGKVDGKFGSGTVSALKDFQKKNGLTQDGVCGAQTRTVLFGANPIYAAATATPAPTTATVITEDNVVTIKSGSRGSAVLALQKRLVELGYYSSRLDGVCLEDDIKAIQAFQKANSLKVDGIAGYATQALMFSTAAVTGDVGSTTLSTSLRYGDSGNDVTTLQNRLIELGYLTGTADGNFGTATKTALVAFQKANNLVRDGVAGTNTQSVLFSNSAVKNTVSTSTTLKQGTISDAVKDLQERLITLGYLSGTADGNFGAKTALALIAFQKANGLSADGIAGTKTLAKINSTSAVTANGSSSSVSSTSPTLSTAPSASNVRYANWYTEVKARCKLYPYATVYDFTTGLSWKVHMFSFGAHADAEPLTKEDTANMVKAFGGVNTWTPKAVWVVFSDGRVYMASTHDMPHEVQHITNNNFAGHLCIHFPRTAAQVAAIGPYATSHQKAIDLGWTATLALASK